MLQQPRALCLLLLSRSPAMSDVAWHLAAQCVVRWQGALALAALQDLVGQPAPMPPISATALDMVEAMAASLTEATAASAPTTAADAPTLAAARRASPQAAVQPPAEPAASALPTAASAPSTAADAPILPAAPRAKAKAKATAQPPAEPAPEPEVEWTCPMCSGSMTIRCAGRGVFYGCRRYPACDASRRFADPTQWSEGPRNRRRREEAVRALQGQPEPEEESRGDGR